MRRRDKTRNRRLSAEDRAQFARERQALVGSLITQKGFEGALVVEHIRGSQYLIRMPDGSEVFASHKKLHTRFGDASADLARQARLYSFARSKCNVCRAVKDIIKYKANLEGYFDVGTADI